MNRPATTAPAEMDERTLDFFGRALELAHSYYELAPAFFWAGIGLLAWTIAWHNLAKMRAGRDN